MLLEASKELRRLAGPGRVLIDSEEGDVFLRRRFTSIGEWTTRNVSRKRSRKGHQDQAERARLIRTFLPWLRSNRKRGWSAYSLGYHLSRTFVARGRRWMLLSDFWFVRGEGLYWNNCISAKGLTTRRSFGRLKKDDFFGQAQAELEREGFRHPTPVALVRPPMKNKPSLEWIFDQDHLEPAPLLKKAAFLAAWLPS